MKRVFPRTRIIFILIAALFYALLPRKKGKNESLGIIQLAKLGDMVCTTPMFRAFKEKYPKGKLVVFGSGVNRAVLQGDPFVDVYETITSSFTETVRQLKQHTLETVCLTSPSLEIAAACIFARVPNIVGPRIFNGWSPYETWSYKILSHFITIRPHHMESYAPREYLRLLEPIGIHTSDTKKHLTFTKEAETTVNAFLGGYVTGGEMLIGILPGAGNEIKSWAPEKFAELINMINGSHQNACFVLIGTDKDNDRRDVILSAINPSVRVIDAMSKFSIDELKAAIARLDMVIGADTGPQYIAEALEVPTIDIVGPVDEREQPPQGKTHRVVVPNRTKPQLFVMNARAYDTEEVYRQAHFTTSQAVYEVFKDLVTLI